MLMDQAARGNNETRNDNQRFRNGKLDILRRHTQFRTPIIR